MNPGSAKVTLNGNVVGNSVSVKDGKVLITLNAHVIVEQGGKLSIEC
jgi:hypothetical protein